MRRGEELVQVELERTPRALEQARVHLAEQPRRVRADLPGCSSGLSARSKTGSAFSAAYSVSTTPFACGKPPSAMPATRRARPAVAAGEIDAGDLEQRDPPRARVDVAPHGLDEARQSGVRSAVSSTVIGSGSFHVVSSSGAGSACRSPRSRGRRACPRRWRAAPARA